ncbi:MAG: hypothetical protein Dbin4_01407 [Alphaproteobacteria bacterium]|nr:hypothetical protein [Alphaproteobacteria bacterium]
MPPVDLSCPASRTSPCRSSEALATCGAAGVAAYDGLPEAEAGALSDRTAAEFEAQHVESR